MFNICIQEMKDTMWCSENTKSMLISQYKAEIAYRFFFSTTIFALHLWEHEHERYKYYCIKLKVKEDKSRKMLPLEKSH